MSKKSVGILIILTVLVVLGLFGWAAYQDLTTALEPPRLTKEVALEVLVADGSLLLQCGVTPAWLQYDPSPPVFWDYRVEFFPLASPRRGVVRATYVFWPVFKGASGEVVFSDMRAPEVLLDDAPSALGPEALIQDALKALDGQAGRFKLVVMLKALDGAWQAPFGVDYCEAGRRLWLPDEALPAVETPAELAEPIAEVHWTAAMILEDGEVIELDQGAFMFHPGDSVFPTCLLSYEGQQVLDCDVTEFRVIARDPPTN